MITYLIFVPILVTVLILLNQLLSINKPDVEKVSSYECGFSPMGDTRTKFYIQYYLVGILFIIFDIEILFIVPFSVVLYSTSLIGFWLVSIFLSILTLGFVYEYKKGALKYTSQQ